MREDETPIETPPWVPPSVKAEIESLRRQDTNNEHSALLTRLETHMKMQDVFNELTKRNRSTGEYCNPAKNLYDPSLSADQIQDCALADTVRHAFYFAIREYASVKPKEIEQERLKLKVSIDLLRSIGQKWPPTVEMYCGEDLLPLARSDAEALQRVANGLEALERHMVSPDHPHVMTNEGADRLVRGVQVALAGFFLDRFGNHLHGTAANLTNAALGTEEATARVSRSAFSGRN